MPQTVIALVEDLLFTAKLRAAAQGAEVRLQTTTQAEDWLHLARTAAPDWLCLDLNFSRADALDLVTQVRAHAAGRNVPIIGFLSHVQTERAQQALTAGCTAAVPRSLFVQQLPALLRDGPAALTSTTPAAPS